MALNLLRLAATISMLVAFAAGAQPIGTAPGTVSGKKDLILTGDAKCTYIYRFR